MLEPQRSPLGPKAANIQLLIAEETLPALALPEQLKGDAAASPGTEDTLSASAPSPAELDSPRPASPTTALLRADEQRLANDGVEEGAPGRDGSSTVAPAPPALEVNTPFESDGMDAIQALLSLQREPSPEARSDTGSSRAASPPPVATRPERPERAQLQSAITKGSGSGDSSIRFYCRFPRCGKGYASTDAVRKHCRQRHLEWLRRLGHGCPALYCRWEE